MACFGKKSKWPHAICIQDQPFNPEAIVRKVNETNVFSLIDGKCKFINNYKPTCGPKLPTDLNLATFTTLLPIIV